jgi:UDP-N-acetylglucosamine pyrophosphorylase
MDNQKLNTERLIASFGKDTYDNWLSVYKSENDKIWNHYYALSGMLNGKYFHLTISNFKENAVEEITINKTTDCKKEIEALLIKFNLV